MNPFDFVKASGSGDSFMPIVIFIIWIAISFFTNAQKKKKRIEQQKQRARDVYRAPEASEAPKAASETMIQNEDKRSPVPEEMRQEQETVLSGREQYRETEPPPQLEERDFSLETQEVEEQSYETQTVAPPAAEVTLPAAVPQQAPVSRVFASNAFDMTLDNDIDSSPITDIFSAEFEEKTAAHLNLSHEEVRKGIVWSEILAAPVALRENSY
jgi:hypothetical protein